jgi:hypothetical protein
MKTTLENKNKTTSGSLKSVLKMKNKIEEGGTLGSK